MTGQHNYFLHPILGNYREDISRQLLLFEKFTGADCGDFMGVSVWPIIRNMYGQKLEGLYFRNNALKPKPKPASSIKLNQFEKQSQSRISLLSNFDDEIDVLFMIRKERYLRDSVSGKYVNQLDDLYGLIRDEFKCLRIEEVRQDSFDFVRRFDTCFFSTPWEGNLLAARSRIDYSQYLEKNKVASVLRDLRIFTGNKVSVNIHEVSHAVSLTAAYYFVAERIFEQLQPKLLISEISSNPINYGFNLAAKKNDVPCAELQHGTIGKYHYPYTDHLYHNSKALSPVTNYLFCLDSATKSYVEQTNGNLTPVYCGLPSIAAWHKAKTQKKIKSDTKAYPQHRVLISLGYDNPLSNLVCDAIAMGSDQYEWLVRLHPAISHLADDFEKEFIKKGYSNVKVLWPTHANLNDLFESIDALVTDYSTTAIEAYSLGKLVVVAGEMGEALFANELQKGEYQLAYSGSQILTLIENKANFSRVLRRNRASNGFKKAIQSVLKSHLKIHKSPEQVLLFEKDSEKELATHLGLFNQATFIAPVKFQREMISTKNAKKLIKAVKAKDTQKVQLAKELIGSALSFKDLPPDKRYSKFTYPIIGNKTLRLSFGPIVSAREFDIHILLFGGDKSNGEFFGINNLFCEMHKQGVFDGIIVNKYNFVVRFMDESAQNSNTIRSAVLDFLPALLARSLTISTYNVNSVLTPPVSESTLVFNSKRLTNDTGDHLLNCQGALTIRSLRRSEHVVSFLQAAGIGESFIYVVGAGSYVSRLTDQFFASVQRLGFSLVFHDLNSELKIELEKHGISYRLFAELKQDLHLQSAFIKNARATFVFDRKQHPIFYFGAFSNIFNFATKSEMNMASINPEKQTSIRSFCQINELMEQL